MRMRRGGGFGMHSEEKWNYIQGLVRKPGEKKDCLEDLGADGKIILR